MARYTPGMHLIRIKEEALGEDSKNKFGKEMQILFHEATHAATMFGLSETANQDFREITVNRAKFERNLFATLDRSERQGLQRVDNK